MKTCGGVTFCNERRTLHQRLYEISIGSKQYRAYGNSPIQALSLFATKIGVTSIVGIKVYWLAGHERIQVL